MANKVLIATDLGASSEAALAFGVGLARQLHGRVILLYTYEHVLAGSVAERVAQRAGCPVLVVPGPARA